MNNENVRAILKPNGYKTQRELGLKEKLFNYDYSPMVAYGIDKGSHIEYEEATDPSDLEQKIADVKKIALNNNSKIEVKYSVENVEDDKLFIADPHEYAAEKILDKQFLNLVSKELNSSSFLVGIPHQGVFAAVSTSSSFKDKFLGFIKHKFENPEANQITPHVFEIFDGEIIAVGGEDTGGNKNTISKKVNGDLVVEMESTNFEEFKDQVSNGFSQALLLATRSKDFSGNIIFNENNKDFKFDRIVLDKCVSYNDQIISNEMAQTVCKAMSGNEIIPSFTQCGKEIRLKGDNDTIGNEEVKIKKKKWWQFGK